jgi:peroxiredoxin
MQNLNYFNSGQCIKIFLFILFTMVFVACGRVKPSKTGLEGTSLPTFNLTLMDNKSILNSNMIRKDEPFVILYFSTQCPYCRVMIKDMMENKEAFLHTPIYFITQDSIGAVKIFFKDYKLSNNINVAIDKNNYIANYLKIDGLPYIAIYGKNKILKEVLKGRVKVNQLEDLVKNY